MQIIQINNNDKNKSQISITNEKKKAEEEINAFVFGEITREKSKNTLMVSNQIQTYKTADFLKIRTIRTMFA